MWTFEHASFLPHDTMQARNMLSLCVRLSITSQCSTKTAKPTIMQATLYINPGTVLFIAKDFCKILT